MGQLTVSIIVPTLNEAENLPELLERLAASIGPAQGWEAVVVDDGSRDGTERVCGELARQYPLRLIVRDRPANGLAGAVLRGLRESRGDLVVVMDADLQHPPESVPALLEPLRKGEADFVIGSRYVAGGSMEARWGMHRRLFSLGATALARPVAGRICDPMSGFFAFKRELLNGAAALEPRGFKIGLELICKCRAQRIVEVPIHFARRQHGESKLNMREQCRYLDHLSQLYTFRFPRMAPAGKALAKLTARWWMGLATVMALMTLGCSAMATLGLAWCGPALLGAVLAGRAIRLGGGRRHTWRRFAAEVATQAAICLAAACLWRGVGAVSLLAGWSAALAAAEMIRGTAWWMMRSRSAKVFASTLPAPAPAPAPKAVAAPMLAAQAPGAAKRHRAA